MTAPFQFGIDQNYTIPSQTFKAEWPKELDPQLRSTCSKVMRVIGQIISWIIFPIALIKIGCSHLRDYLFRVAVIPASNYRKQSGFEEQLQDFEERMLRRFQGAKVKMTSPDGATIDAAFFPGRIKDKVLICTIGNGAFWQGMSERVEMLKQTGCSILILNPREVGNSEGKLSSEGLALDVYTAYEYLINEHQLDPNNILLVGHSLGASYGAEGAALIQKKYQDKQIAMISDRSFCDLATEAGAITKKSGHYFLGNSCIGKMLCEIGGVIAPIGVRALGMQINQKEAFLSLKGQKGVIFSKSDHIVPESASLYRSIETALPEEVEVINMNLQYSAEAEHNRAFSDAEKIQLYRLIEKILKLEQQEYRMDSFRFFQIPAHWAQ